MTAPMPETMTPREKVARIVSPKCWEFYDRHAADPCMKAEINHEVDPSLQLVDDILTALASGSGDHAELVSELRGVWLKRVLQNRAADALEALIAQNAALTDALERAGQYQTQFHNRATEAERKLAEARGLLGRWRSDLPTEALEDVTDTFLSSTEAERG